MGLGSPSDIETTGTDTEPPDPILSRLEEGPGVSSAARSFVWAASSRASQQGLQFLASIVLARLLLPAQFGVYAVIASVTLFANLFTDLGLSQAIIHAPVPTRRFLSTAFWINAATGAVLTLAAFGAGKGLAVIYGRPALTHLMLIAGLTFGLDLGIVHTALLERTFHFKRIALVETSAFAIGVAATIVGAVIGLGAVSLVLGPVVATGLQSVLLWVMVPWRPRLAASKRSASMIVNYSRGIVGANVINYWSRNADNLLLGRFASATSLGFYSRAYQLMFAPIGQISLVFGRVLLPTMIRVRHLPGEPASTWLRGVKLIFLTAMPVCLLFATAAPALVAVLYGPRWAGVVVPLEFLSLSGVGQVLAVTTGPIYQALGRNDALLRQGVLLGLGSVTAIVAGLPWGGDGVAASIMIETWLIFWVPIRGACRILGIPLMAVFREVAGVAAGGVAFTCASLSVRLTLAPRAAAVLVVLVQAVAGGAALILTITRADPSLAHDLRQRVARLAGSARNTVARQ